MTEDTTKANQEPKIDSLNDLDAQYSPFLSFEDWSRNAQVDAERWKTLRSQMKRARSSSDKGRVARAGEMIVKVAAVETGAIEELYPIERGFTITVAFASAVAAQAAMDRLTELGRNLVRSQMEAYQWIMDFATEARPITPAWIRQLHEQVCAAQETYTVCTPDGPSERQLPKGEYKAHPNHVITSDSSVHVYAPVESTAAEMTRYCDELSTGAFQGAHPVLQAAYAHHALTQVHPFSDGNGRVSRALASVFTYRDAWVPSLFFSDEKDGYFDALSEADDGRPATFVRLTQRGAERAMEMFLQALRGARQPPLEEAVDQINSLFETRGGYDHADLDRRGRRLLGEVHQAIGISGPTDTSMGTAEL